MLVRIGMLAALVCLFAEAPGWGQALPTSATIESIPLEVTMPDRYQVGAVLEPVRRVSIVAPADGLIRSLEASVGLNVRANQELSQLDRAEAQARLKIALAEVKEKEPAPGGGIPAAASSARLEAAQARAELAQLELDRLTLRAPFPGQIVAVPVSSGQFVLKGTTIAELADVTSFRALVPVDRRAATQGGEVKVFVEELEQSAKIQSVVPLPESFAALRDLAAPFAAAWISVPNPKSELAPGMRIRSENLPTGPIATVPREAVKNPDTAAAGASPTVQVIRSEYVTNVPVRVLGKVGAERIQITGGLRSTDALIVSSSVPLLAGTLVRFSQGPAQAVEGTTPSPERRGAEAGITGPSGAGSGPSRTRPAAGNARPPRRPANIPAGGQGSTPF
jgi:multidrug efflux pump subunit AcrA (membrane-fusion protein)